MTRILKSKYKIDRRLRCNLWGRPKSPFNRRDYPPGLNGQNRKKNPLISAYNLWLNKSLNAITDILLKNNSEIYSLRPPKIKGNTSENLIELLERRLDATVYRMKFSTTIFAARQFVSHGHILVNGKKVTISSYSLKDGDIVEVKEKSREIPVLLEAISSTERETPQYLSVDYDKLKGTFVKGPKLDEVPYPVVMEPNLVIEYYSR